MKQTSLGRRVTRVCSHQALFSHVQTNQTKKKKSCRAQINCIKRTSCKRAVGLPCRTDIRCEQRLLSKVEEKSLLKSTRCNTCIHFFLILQRANITHAKAHQSLNHSLWASAVECYDQINCSIFLQFLWYHSVQSYRVSYIHMFCIVNIILLEQIAAISDLRTAIIEWE